MQVLSKFSLDGKTCFMIDDDGFTYPLTERGLYEQSILEGLIAAGYKVLDYHGSIISPDGVSIMDFVEESCSPTDDEIQAMYDIEEGAMSEADATAYFTRDAALSSIKMKEPKVRIKTREELIAYLQRYSRAMRLGVVDLDVQPINSFVAPEALFSLEELVENPEVIDYLRIIEERRKLRTYTAYEALVKFLQSEGVLGDKFTADDIRTAYLSWGICGIKASIIEMKTKLGVTARITDINESATANDKTYGIGQELCLLSKDGKIIYSGGVEDISDIEDYYSAAVYPADIPGYEELMRSTKRWNDNYQIIKCWVKRPTSRVYMTLLSENGCTFKAKIDSDYMVIQSISANRFTAGYLKIFSPAGVYRALSEYNSKDEFIKKSLAIAKVRDLVNAKTIEAPVKNSFDLCHREGVAPMNVINYITTRIYEDKKGEFFPGGAKYALNEAYHAIDYTGSADIYRDGPELKYIKKYNPDELEYDSLDTLIDIMLSTRSQMDQDGTYLQVNKDDSDVSAADVRNELIVRPVERLEFARDCMDGLVSIDYLNEGKMLDEDAEVLQLSNLLLRIISIDSDISSMTVDEVERALKDIDNNDVVSIDDVIRSRTNAYRGYLKDRAILNARRAEQCSTAMYVTRVFRELSNADISEQRHYMMEGIVLDLFNKKRNPMVAVQNNITNALREAIKSLDIDNMYKVSLDLEAPSIALKIMFAIALGQVRIVRRSESSVVIAIKEDTGDGNFIDMEITLASDIFAAAGDKEKYVIKWVTLCDWCDMEMTSGAFNLYCLNANIDPWYVKPKNGVKLPVYNFEINWVQDKVYNTFPEDFRRRVAECNGRVRAYESNYSATALLDEGDIMDFVNETIDYTEENIDQVLDPVSAETIRNYNKRFVLHNRAAGKRGEYLRRMRLRSDTVYANYAVRYDANRLADDEYENIVNKDDSKQWLFNIRPIIEAGKGVKDSFLESGKNRISRFELATQQYNDVVRWKELISGDFKPYTVNMVIGNKLYCVSPKGQITRDLDTLSKEDADKLTEKGIFYQLSAREYLIKTTTYDFKIEIM